jgi:galactose-1-phosphate uridylyltransferase
VIVAAHRQSRPWIGQTVASPQTQPPTYVSDCYLCPGNARVSGAAHPAYTDVCVFDNDHPCVGPNAPAELTQPPQRAAVSGLSDDEAASLARALKDVVVRYDNLWREPFPYVMPLHQAPTDGENYDEFHFFVGFLPPLRRPNTLKYLAGDRRRQLS